jgi:ABC-type transport system substrate-binding protein
MRWCDPRVDDILAGMRGSYDRAGILRAFRKLDAIFVDEAPSIQLFVWRGNVLESERLRGYHDNILTSFDEMMDVDI